MTQNERYARLVLTQLPRIGPATYKHILLSYGSASAFLADKSGSLYKKVASGIGKAKSKSDEIDMDTILLLGDSDYPAMLTQTPDAPLLIYFRGDKSLLKRRSCAIVGTRAMTTEGQALTQSTAEALAEQGVVIVSGLAYGVDAVAHAASIKTGTIAVLGTGVFSPHPKRNTKLYNRILENGLVLSEFYRTESYDRFVFPRRNRIVAGLSEATIVTEAPAKSGALITARLAFDYGREVFCYPYSTRARTGEGCNILIRDQIAQLVTSPQQILLHLGYDPDNDRPKADLGDGDNSRTVLTLIKMRPRSFEQLTESVTIPTSDLRANLLSLEMRGQISKSATGIYSA